jgi:Na+/melibiose symporter-like transporter
MKGSLIIVGFFILGIVCGLMRWVPELNSNVSFLTLCALLFCVGVMALYFYPISKEYNENMQAELAARRKRALATTE